MEITVKIQADELAGAINNLAEALLVDNNNLAESINNLALSVDPIEAVKTEPKKVARGSQKVEDKPKPVEPPKAEPKEEPKAEKDEPQYKIEDISFFLLNISASIKNRSPSHDLGTPKYVE